MLILSHYNIHIHAAEAFGILSLVFFFSFFHSTCFAGFQRRKRNYYKQYFNLCCVCACFYRIMVIKLVFICIYSPTKSIERCWCECVYLLFDYKQHSFHLVLLLLMLYTFTFYSYYQYDEIFKTLHIFFLSFSCYELKSQFCRYIWKWS
jgi:hypothetical protein